MFERIDSIILAFFTKISHKFQRLTGKTNFFLAKIFFTLVALSVLLGIGDYWFELVSKETNILNILLSLFVCFLISRDIINCDKAEENSLLSEAAKIEFSFTDNSPFLRVLWLFLSIFSLYLVAGYVFGMMVSKVNRILDILYYSYAMLVTICIYFLAVHPLLSRKSKVREWIETFANMFRKSVPVKSRG